MSTFILSPRCDRRRARRLDPGSGRSRRRRRRVLPEEWHPQSAGGSAAAGQRFYGEGQTVLNGSRLLTGFRREGRYWVANSQLQRVPKHGECLPSAPACNQPEALFIDDRPLTKVLEQGCAGEQRSSTSIMPAARSISPTIRRTARSRRRSRHLPSKALRPTCLISNVTVEKYASAAQKGAIHAREGARWTVENCEVRFNSGAGISVGTGSRVRNCDIHHNGQIGIEGNGRDIRIEGNHIWSNNIYGFDPAWEAGGVKIAESDGVTFRGNHVHDNDGPGLWCDIECRNVVYEENLVENNQRHRHLPRDFVQRGHPQQRGAPQRPREQGLVLGR